MLGTYKVYAKFFFGIFIQMSILPALHGQNLHFNKLYPDYNGDQANCVIVQDDGYLIAGGGWSDSLDRYASIKFTKTDKYGNLLWKKTIGEVGKGYFLGIDGSYIPSQFSSASYVISSAYSQGKASGLFMKLDANFDTVWTRTIVGTTATTDIKQFSTGIQTREGDLLGVGVVGHKTSNVSFVGDILVVRTDSFGNVRWEKKYHRGSYDYGFRVLQTYDGGYLITGVSSNPGNLSLDLFLLKLDQFGNEEWRKAYSSTWNEGLYPGILPCSTGGYYIWGSSFDDNQSPANPNPSFDKLSYVAKLDENGNEEWRTNFNRGYFYSAIYKVIELNSGDLLFCGDKWIGGYTTGDSKGWITKLNRNGDVLWEKYYVNTGHVAGSVWLSDIKSVGDSLIVCTGSGFIPDGTGVYRQDLWLMALDAKGELKLDLTTDLPKDIRVIKDLYSIYPNPNTGTFSLRKSVNDDMVEITIYSLSGQKLWNSIVIGEDKVDSELPPGAYIYEVKDRKGASHFGKVLIAN